MAKKYYHNDSKAASFKLKFHSLRKYEGFYMFNGVLNLVFSLMFVIFALISIFPLQTEYA